MTGGMLVLVGAVVLFLHCCEVTVVVGSATCPDGWVKRKNYCYYFSSTAEKQSFAASRCHNMSAELASIHDAEENTFVINVKKPVSHNHWLGMQRKSEISTGKTLEWKRRDWHWYDGTTLDFVNWGEIQPNTDTFLCAIIRTIATGTIATGLWDDRSCDDNYLFICKRALTQLQTSTEESIHISPAVSTAHITKQSSTHSTSPLLGIHTMSAITSVAVDDRETTPTNAGTPGQGLNSHSTHRQHVNIVTSTSTYRGLETTTTTHMEEQTGERENGSGMGLYIGVAAASLVVIVAVLVITIIMCRRRNSKSNNPGTAAKSSVEADGDFVFVQNKIASPQQSEAANNLQGRQGNARHHQYDNVNLSDLRTSKPGASNLNGKSSGVTPPLAAMLDVTQPQTQATSMTANSDQDVEALYAKPLKKQKRSDVPTLETTDSAEIEYQENCLYSESTGDDRIVVENDLYG